MLTANTTNRATNHSLFVPAQTGCPIKDNLDHASKLGLHRFDYEVYSVQGERLYRPLLADGNAAEERQSWITSQTFHDRTFAHKSATEQELGTQFLTLLNRILAETDAQYKREVASHYYQLVINGAGDRISVLLGVLAELKAIAQAIAPDTEDTKARLDSLAALLTAQVGEELAYRFINVIQTITEGETEEQQERMIDDSLTQLKASEAEAFVSKLEAYAENLDAVTLVSLEEIPHFSHQIKSGCANFDEEVAQKQRMISRSGTTSYNDEYYFGRHWREVSAEGSSAEQQIASAQHDLWDDKVASNQAFEFAGHVVEFEEDQLPLALAGLKTEAAKWYCFEQPAWTPWSREEATVAIQAYAHAHGLNSVQNLKAACPNSKQGIERSKDETLQTVLRWAEQKQIKLRLSVEQVSRRVWFLLDKYSEQQDFTDVVIEDGLVIETSERSLHLSQQTTALMVELQADKHLLWVRSNPTYRRLHLALARTKSIAEANQLLMEAYAITQEGKTGLEAKRLSVAQLTALKTRKEVTLSRIRNHPSAPARALLAQVERFAASSKLEGNEFLSQLNQLPLHEQDAVIGKLRSKQIRVTPSETYRSLLADVKGAKEVKANSGKEKWWKGIRWACYERNTPNTEYLQGVQQRYMALPRYEQTAVWQHLNS